MSQRRPLKPKNKVCCFCNSSDDDELEYGKFYQCNEITTHYYCLLLSSNMEQRGNDNEGILGFLAEDIRKELRRGKRLTCSYCKKSGATLGCCNTKCKKIFHLPCGLRAGTLHQFFGEFRSYCKSHRPKQRIDNDIKKEVEQQKEILCCICYDSIDKHDHINTLWAPCCKKNTWFHRRCVQRLALSAGYFFKCPLCNNQREFEEAMKNNGIFIPSQDASWELVPNAFEELLYRHNRCDAVTCLCPKGRNHTSRNVKWQLILCRVCGSQGVHAACAQSKWASHNWECNECLSILRASTRKDESTTSRKEQESDSDSSDTDISVGHYSPTPSSLSNYQSIMAEDRCQSPNSERICSSPITIRPGPRCFKIQQEINAYKLLSRMPTDAKSSGQSRSSFSQDESDSRSLSSKSSLEDEDVCQDFQDDDTMVPENDDEIEILHDQEPEKERRVENKDGEKNNAQRFTSVEGISETNSSSLSDPLELSEKRDETSKLITEQNVRVDQVSDERCDVNSVVSCPVELEINDEEDEPTMNIKITNVTSLAPLEFVSVTNLSSDKADMNLKRKSDGDRIDSTIANDSVNTSKFEKCKRIRSTVSRENASSVFFPCRMAENSLSENRTDSRFVATKSQEMNPVLLKCLADGTNAYTGGKAHIQLPRNDTDDCIILSSEQNHGQGRKQVNCIAKKRKNVNKDMVVSNPVAKDNDNESTKNLRDFRISEFIRITKEFRNFMSPLAADSQWTEEDCDGDAGTCPAAQRRNYAGTSTATGHSRTVSPETSPRANSKESCLDAKINRTHRTSANGNDVFDCVASNPGACDRLGVIPKYVSLRDLKFRVGDSGGLQMILYDTFSVNMNVPGPLKEEANIHTAYNKDSVSFHDKPDVGEDPEGNGNSPRHLPVTESLMLRAETASDDHRATKIECPSHDVLQSDLPSVGITSDSALDRKCKTAQKTEIPDSDFRSDKLSNLEYVYYPLNKVSTESIRWPYTCGKLFNSVFHDKGSSGLDPLMGSLKTSQSFDTTDISMDSCMKYFHDFNDINVDNRYSNSLIGTVSSAVFQYSRLRQENTMIKTRSVMKMIQCASLHEDSANSKYVDREADNCCRVSIDLKKIHSLVASNPSLFFKHGRGCDSKLSGYIHSLTKSNDLRKLISVPRKHGKRLKKSEQCANLSSSYSTDKDVSSKMCINENDGYDYQEVSLDEASSVLDNPKFDNRYVYESIESEKKYISDR